MTRADTITDTSGRVFEKDFAFLLCDNDFNRLHVAFMLAASALAMNRSVIIFATGPAVLTLCRETEALWEKEERQLAMQGVATLGTLRDALLSMDARLLVCETGLRRTGKGAGDLIEKVEVVGMPTFLDLSAGYKLVTF
ncbi:DsrE family protein [Acetobacter sp.]|jgi:predicted peroxiredoxin|uniref:DsrE family protein n=1 Tax=Acetobacter sp. TaxID=440 RepID=UPI0025BB81D7|nr:DsrE family protein [Acetobacter sp.]MCH4092104.1 DsrE family protein [Acetobacter sp.]MCI1299979.1 DsrE family protein [Acetobacter sp.]MCI1315997.1 DsrE family protein [Acetobacter sp.]